MLAAMTIFVGIKDETRNEHGMNHEKHESHGTKKAHGRQSVGFWLSRQEYFKGAYRIGAGGGGWESSVNMRG